METICIKYQILFSGKKLKKYFNMLSAENFTQSIKAMYYKKKKKQYPVTSSDFLQILYSVQRIDTVLIRIPAIFW